MNFTITEIIHPQSNRFDTVVKIKTKLYSQSPMTNLFCENWDEDKATQGLWGGSHKAEVYFLSIFYLLKFKVVAPQSTLTAWQLLIP